ncbi:MAG: valine--tRNA ligase [Halobacteriota archaeon]|jgi:valyl-tRNA synthetase
MAIPKNFDHQYIESKWFTAWDSDMYRYRGEGTKERFVIDTPPPYPTGNFHLGNALNWCYIDFIARYKRMKGYDVKFPQGWDCHGLPTEVKVETTYNITKNQIPRAEFRGLCESLTRQNIALMKGTMQRLAFSIDWSQEFVTMDKAYYAKTQKSFVQMYNNDLIYRDEHPVNWCPRCETAIAFAEVDYDSRSTILYHLFFEGSDLGPVEIATTRPELLGACVAVAVSPSDERYVRLIGGTVRTPLYDDEVAIIGDEAVDPTFGTGAVMICTFGDKQDVRWWKKHNLPLKKVIGKDGRMTDERYRGLTIGEAKERIVGDLFESKLLQKQERIEQNVGFHDRCKTPIEILSESQWFVKIDKERILARAAEIEWIPSYSFHRLKNWTESVEWDWCISRQRIFATPIPVWYCDGCGKLVVAEERWLPLDPTQESPRCLCECGSSSFTPEYDVLDTWMDSSLSALNAAGWPNAQYKRQFPTQLRPQGHDIIRTWAFYTILRSDALAGSRPWERVIVNGMVLGEDNQKMSKSLGNIIAPESVIEQYGTDAVRQWAAVGGSVGSDVQYNTKDLTASSRFLTKLWNVFRFAMLHLTEGVQPVTYGLRNPSEIWLIFNLTDLVDSVTSSMDRFAFDEALKEIRSFVWNTLADHYIEAVKGRLYERDAYSLAALHLALNTIVKLLAPFCPFFSEELFSHINPGDGSVHLHSWPVLCLKPVGATSPESTTTLVDVQQISITASQKDVQEARRTGELVKEIIASVRRYKSEQRIALNARIEGIHVYLDRDMSYGAPDIQNALNADIEYKTGKPDILEQITEIRPNLGALGPRFKSEAKRVVELIQSTPAEAIADQIGTGSVMINGYEFLPTDFIVKKELFVGGVAVDVIKLSEGTILVKRT